ncbi:hypothetical protein V6N13_059229 [Hibiscus sabdariffa]
MSHLNKTIVEDETKSPRKKRKSGSLQEVDELYGVKGDEGCVKRKNMNTKTTTLPSEIGFRQCAHVEEHSGQDSMVLDTHMNASSVVWHINRLWQDNREDWQVVEPTINMLASSTREVSGTWMGEEAMGVVNRTEKC